jgi:hypothetical protein
MWVCVATIPLLMGLVLAGPIVFPGNGGALFALIAPLLFRVLVLGCLLGLVLKSAASWKFKALLTALVIGLFVLPAHPLLYDNALSKWLLTTQHNACQLPDVPVFGDVVPCLGMSTLNWLNLVVVNAAVPITTVTFLLRLLARRG